MKNRIYSIRYLFVAAMAVLLLYGMSSCGTSRSVSGGRTATQTAGRKTPSDGNGKRAAGGQSGKPSAPPAHINFASMSLSMPAEKLLREADTWIGTPYLYGGNDRQGIDCSGFVSQVFRNSVGISLPRTSREQHSFCAAIDKTQLQPGDLVFFTIRGGSTVGHVGIYIGDDRMIHASSSKGVVISSLSTNYYVVNYYGSGRVEKFFAMGGSGDDARRGRVSKEPVKAKPSTATADRKKPDPVDPVKETKMQIASADPAEDAVRQAVAMRVGRIGNVAQGAAGSPSVPVTGSSADGDEEPDSGLEDFFD